MMYKLSLSLVFLLIFGLGLTAFILQSNMLAGFELSTPPTSTVSESMQGVTAIRFDENGAKIQTIRVSKWYQYTKDPLIHMEHPVVALNHQDGSQWFLQANSGIGYQSTTTQGQFEKITFLQKVKFVQIKDQLVQLNLDTEQLNYKPDTKRAYTADPVYVHNDNLSMTATGLEANLVNKEITFLGKTRSTYVR